MCFLPMLLALCACAGVRRGRADKPGTISAEKLTEFQAAIEPYAKKARETLPGVKKRYLNGLVEEEMLYVVVRLPDQNGGFEQAYVRVRDWQGEDLLGTVASRLSIAQSQHTGVLISFKEEAIVDWVLVKADGYEEGNYVGRFLEQYKP